MKTRLLILTAFLMITHSAWADVPAAPAPLPGAPPVPLGVPPLTPPTDTNTSPGSPTIPMPGTAPVPMGMPSLPPPTDTSTSPGGPTIPTGGFDASRYEVLWTKSPFAVATSEDAATESPDYSFVGFSANIDGVSYASLIEKDNNAHFLISTDKSVKGMTLTSIKRNKDGSGTSALIKKDDQTITLKLEQAPVASVAPGGMPPPLGSIPLPPGAAVGLPQMQAPGANIPGFGPPGANRPFPRIHRTPIHLPPMPGQQPAPPPPPPQPQTH